MHIEHKFDHRSSVLPWYAVWTRSRQEKVAASMLETLGFTQYLPLKSEVHQWSDRRQRVSVPLFPGYLFVRIDMLGDDRTRVLRVNGVAGIVGNQKGPLAVPDRQIDDIRLILEKRVECTVLPLLDEGDRVRVMRGLLAGVEGRLLRSNAGSSLVISVEMIHKSIAVRVAREDVELVEHRAA
jgi:transcription antitermination factor NusG